MRLFKHLALATVLAASVFASRAALADKAAPAADKAAPAADKAAPAADKAAPAADSADSIVVLAKHTPGKPTDPVQVRFEKFQVTKATFDPKKIEGGKATIEIDATSLKTGVDDRDKHLNTPDFLDTAKFSKIVVEIDKVKKKADKTFTAEATVKFRDVTKKYPVTFDVVETKADSIRIKGEASFSRLDFKVGKDPKEPKSAPVDTGLTIQLALTLKKT
jgi:polyisoprenoid-binding protein YceI